jgi:hypothetical protein
LIKAGEKETIYFEVIYLKLDDNSILEMSVRVVSMNFCLKNNWNCIENASDS